MKGRRGKPVETEGILMKVVRMLLQPVLVRSGLFCLFCLWLTIGDLLFVSVKGGLHFVHVLFRNFGVVERWARVVFSQGALGGGEGGVWCQPRLEYILVWNTRQLWNVLTDVSPAGVRLFEKCHGAVAPEKLVEEC